MPGGTAGSTRVTGAASVFGAASAGGVYAVDGGGHAFNFVVGYDRRIFLIDSNQHIFRRIITTADFVAMGHNDDWQDSYRYNYGNPPRDEDGEPLVLYYWGPLANRYAVILRDSRVGRTPAGSYEVH